MIDNSQLVKTQMRFKRRALSAAILSTVLAMSAHAQQQFQVGNEGYAGEEEKAVDALGLEEIVVTAAPGRTTKMESSVSVTDVDQDAIANFTPRSEAEVLLLIPGIRAESTGGTGGNSNITVRGLPLAAGGAKYVQLQEDGLPVVEYGDIAFGNNDFWLRYDYSVESVQAIRGGSSSTLASQAPGAVINYISKTGEEAGGQIGLTKGLSYDETRLDFSYGSPLTDTLRFHVGGFYREGEGPREVSWNAMKGYQIKANLTKEFEDDSGYVRFYFKHLDDRAPTYTSYPQTAKVSGDKVSDFGTFPGFDARKDTNLSKYYRSFLTVAGNGETIVGRMDGIHPQSTAFGIEFHKEINDQWTLENKFRQADTKGVFAAPFMNVTPLTDVLNYSVTTADGTTYNAAEARYANGPLAGQTVTSENLGHPFVNTNPALFTEMHDMGNYANDLSLTGDFDVGEGLLTAKAGYYRSGQNIKMDWHWNGSISEARSDDPALIDLFDDAGNRLTDNGLTGYNDQWGGCCARNYDLEYTADAVYLSLAYSAGDLDLEGSVRHEVVNGNGTFAPSSSKIAQDVNGDGQLSIAEQNVYVADVENVLPVDYEVDYTSYSLGANYLLSNDLSVFARISEGHRSNADRLVENRVLWDSSGDLSSLGEQAAVNKVEQQEVGVKFRSDAEWGNFAFFTTLFHSEAAEYNTDLTVEGGAIKNQAYETYGVEFESVVNWGNLSLHFNAVYTDAEIVEDPVNGNEGNIPLATPDWMYLVAPTYHFERGVVGLILRGQTETYSNDNDNLLVEGQYFVNAFARYELMDGLELGLNVNNLFNEWGQSGRLDQSDPASVATNGALIGASGLVTNRPELGRTISGSIRYTF